MSVDMGFLKLLLEHVDLPSICAQTGVPGLNRDRVYELKVALPPLMEQQRIVDLLDAVEGVQTAVRSVERDGDRAYHAVLEDQFNVLAEKTRSEVPLGEVLTRERRPIDVEPTSLYEEIGIRSHGKGIFHKAPKTGLEIGKKRIFSIEPGDLVFNIVFAWEGAVALAGPEEAGRCASHRFPTYRTEHDVTAEFLLHFFRTRRGRSYLDLASPGSAGRNRTLNRGMLMEMTVPDAPVDQQREVVQSLVAVEELRDRATAYGEASAKAQSSLLQDLLTGHHRVPESYDGILENAS